MASKRSSIDHAAATGFGRSARVWAAALLLLLVVGVTYRFSLDNGFHFDDKQNIHQNPWVRLDHLSVESLKQAATRSPHDKRPLPYLTFAFDWWRGGGNPRTFQWSNVSLHALASLTVFLLLLTVLGQVNGHLSSQQIFAALSGAALWALHPIQVQSVTYIVQRMALMAALFSLLAVLAYLRARLTGSSFRRWIWSLLCILALICGAASKENAWITPALLVLAELGVIRNRRSELFRSRLEAGLGLLAGVASFVVFLAALFERGPLARFTVGYTGRDFTLIERLLTEPRVILFHLSQLIWPLPSRFSLEHDVILSTSLFEPMITLPVLFLAIAWCVLGLWLLARPERRIAGFFLLWVPLTLAIESTIVPLELIFEHRMYLPSVGLFGLLALGLDRLMIRVSRPHMTLGVPVMVMAILLGISTTRYLSVWSDPVRLAESSTRRAPGSARAWSNLALAYLVRGQNEEAEKAVRSSLELAPNDYHNLELLGLLEFDRGRLVEARELFNRALAAGPPSSNLLNHLGEVELAVGAYEEAERLFRRAAELKSWVPTYRWNRALALERLDRCAEAQTEWQDYLRLSQDEAGKAEVRAHLTEVHATPGGRCYSP